MIEGLSEEKIETTEEQEKAEVELATIVSIGTSGLVLKFDGEDAAREKDYKCNAGVKFKAGDRVKIHKMSGTYVVEYSIGAPNSAVPWGLPTGGSSGQILKRTASGAEWSDEKTGLPVGGSTGQVLKRTASGAEWANEKTELPTGGANGQILKRTANGTEWANEKTELPTGGANGQVLTKRAGGAAWETPAAPVPKQIKNGSYYVTMSNYGALSSNCQSLGFFGSTPSTKKYLTTSSTLTDVINLLKAYGLG